MSYIYLASPYTADTVALKNKRYNRTLKYTAECVSKGEIIFSPIVHGHNLSKLVEMPTDWSYWEHNCKAFVTHCSKLRVLMLPGWKKSVGVQAEIKYATEIGKEVEYVEPTS